MRRRTTGMAGTAIRRPKQSTASAAQMRQTSCHSPTDKPLAFRSPLAAEGRLATAAGTAANDANDADDADDADDAPPAAASCRAATAASALSRCICNLRKTSE